MSRHHKSENPAGQGGAGLGDSSTAIEAAALFSHHTRGRRNHLLAVRRNPTPRHGREWLARYFDLQHEFAISTRQLRSPTRFVNVAFYALKSRVPDDGELLFSTVDLVNYDHEWRELIDRMLLGIGGAS